MNDKFHMTLEENLFLAKKLLVESIYSTTKSKRVDTTIVGFELRNATVNATVNSTQQLVVS